MCRYLAWAGSDQELTLEEVADCAHVHPRFVEELMDFGMITPLSYSGNQAVFQASVVLRIRRIVRIKRDLGVNLPGIAVILDLTEELERLRRKLEEISCRVDPF
jgi:DNA-binding transcriptional MerR regulator